MDSSDLTSPLDRTVVDSVAPGGSRDRWGAVGGTPTGERVPSTALKALGRHLPRLDVSKKKEASQVVLVIKNTPFNAGD